jgi:Ca-activated chloride channel homolog
MEQRPVWLWAAGGVLLLLIVFKFLPGPGMPSGSGPGSAGGQSAPAGAIRISIASGGNKEEWIHPAVRSFNDASPRDSGLQHNGKPVFVEFVQETVDGRTQDYRSGTMVADILSGKIKPTIISPGEESWSVKFQREWQAINGRAVARDVGPTVIRSPLVIATWQSRARALGCWPTPQPECTWDRVRALASAPEGWGTLGHPEWGSFKMGYGYAGESNSGTLAAITMCTVGAGKTGGLTIGDVGVETGCGAFLAGIEKAKIHSGTRSDWLLEQMTTGGPEYLEAILAYEAEVITTNRSQGQNLREPLVSIYPQDGTVVVGHPFTILEGVPWVDADQVAAAKLLQKYLLSSEQQREVFTIGFRPADPNVRLESPIEAAYGANPQATIVALEVPDGPVIDRIIEVWHRVKKHATVVLLFDKSGSMAGTKIGAAVKGAQGFVQSMDRDDRIIWLPFDSALYPAVEGFGSDIGEELVGRIGSTVASGGTSLYDALLKAHDALEEHRREDPTGRRYGIVLLSDGKDESSRNTLGVVEARLRPHEADPTGIQIHTIAIGSDADENVLRKIANAGHGRYWKGNTVEQMVSIYRSIATYY